MIKFENTEVMGWEHAIRGMRRTNVVLPSSEQWEAIIIGTRNPMNSWDKSDSKFVEEIDFNPSDYPCGVNLGKNDLDLMRRLAADGPVHAKYRRMITVIVTITAPLYWWKEFDTYKVGTVANSCSTMHKIHAKEFTLEDFSCEHLSKVSLLILEDTIKHLNWCREVYLENKNKGTWWQMIQLLPSSYNQKRTVMMNYEVLANIYKSRRNHKMDEWSKNYINVDSVDTSPGEGVFGFCDWIKTLPYSELIIQEVEENDQR